MRNWDDRSYIEAVDSEISKYVREAIEVIEANIPKELAKDFMELLSISWQEMESSAKRIAKQIGLNEYHFRAIAGDYDFFELVLLDYMNESRAECFYEDRAAGF